MYKIMGFQEMPMQQEVSADQVAENVEKSMQGGYDGSMQELKRSLESSRLENWDAIFEQMKAEHDALFAEQMAEIERLKNEPIN